MVKPCICPYGQTMYALMVKPCMPLWVSSPGRRDPWPCRSAASEPARARIRDESSGRVRGGTGGGRRLGLCRCAGAAAGGQSAVRGSVLPTGSRTTRGGPDVSTRVGVLLLVTGTFGSSRGISYPSLFRGFGACIARWFTGKHAARRPPPLHVFRKRHVRIQCTTTRPIRPLQPIRSQTALRPELNMDDPSARGRVDAGGPHPRGPHPRGRADRVRAAARIRVRVAARIVRLRLRPVFRSEPAAAQMMGRSKMALARIQDGL